MEEIYQKVVTIIAEQFEVSVDSLNGQTRFKEDLKADSIALVEMIMAFEDAFGETISDEDTEKIATVQDLIDYITSHQ